jgi:hypothetical protein
MQSSVTKCDFQKLKDLVQILRNNIILLQASENIQEEKIQELTTQVTDLETNTTIIERRTDFIETIVDLFSILNATNTNTNIDTSSIIDNRDFDYFEDDYQKLSFYFKYNEPSIFINLILSVIFNLLLPDNRQINFQGANSSVTYFAINIFPISTIYKNIPYYQYPSTDFWTLLTIDTTGTWVNQVRYFSITPYIGRYTENGQTTDYLANCNSSITSTLLKANNPGIFSTNKGKVHILYTFNRIFANLFDNPREGKYAVLIPNMITNSTFTFVSRFEKNNSINTINFTSKVRAFTFSQYPKFLSQFQTDSSIEIATKEFVQDKLNNVPVINSNYGLPNGNTTNVDNFLTKVKEYNENNQFTPLKIYPYFYLANNNTVVTDVYQLIDSNSDCNALINDYNKNYYNSEAITIRDGNGSLLFSKFTIIALNHVLSGYATSVNIQIYNVETQKSIQTYYTSSDLPSLSESTSASDSYSVPQTQGVYTMEIDTTSSFFEGVNEIAFFERIGYPIAFKKNLSFVNSGPRYTSFTYDVNNPDANPSETDSKQNVQSGNIYNIQTNDLDFSLHLNYNPYSSLNFRVFSE